MGLGKPLKLLARPVQERLPIYLGSIGPKAVRQTGAIADGWLPFMLDPTEPELLLGPLREGAESAGRSLADIDIAPVVPLAIDENLDAARNAVRPWLAFYLGSMGAKNKNFYVELAERQGHGAAAREVQEKGPGRRPPGRGRCGDRRPGRRRRDRDDAGRAGRAAGDLRARGRQHAGCRAVRRRQARRAARAGGGDGYEMTTQPSSPRPEGIAGSSLAGPFPVGAYAEKLREELRKRARVQLFGEVWNFRLSKAKVYFELRDGDGAVPARCGATTSSGSASGSAGTSLVDGCQVVVAGGPDYYPGSRTSSPSFSFDVTGLRIAGEGDLLAQMEALRRALGAAGLFEPQKALARPALPRCIGVVTGEGGKARDDVLAGLRRRGWAGRLVWAFAPVQDRHAAPRDHPRAAGSRGDRGGRGRDRRPRRRLAGRPVRLLRRDALPDGRAAARAR